MNIQAVVALDKERHPERYCPERGCLWRTKGTYCPRHSEEILRAALDPVMQEDPAYIAREEDREKVGGELW